MLQTKQSVLSFRNKTNEYKMAQQTHTKQTARNNGH